MGAHKTKKSCLSKEHFPEWKPALSLRAHDVVFANVLYCSTVPKEFQTIENACEKGRRPCAHYRDQGRC